ncbi:MAG: indolepyruvate ferredoxin oxidoreductase subunit alpha [Deltaproteobacteria bacterium]|nr:indolepyruvate ferredoxin oxidoreductase subunit alpha [Deltaproteobacteria bacterium]MCL5892543.1 indolepyruvate ferredoxin oxidoreductase subunit alpha [Deltaproteobacteria bacterium]
MSKGNLFISGRQGDKGIVLGNEAIARGALEAGIGYASMYPGTPASEIIAALDKNKNNIENLYTEFSLNEHISLHGAIGASWSGIRSLCAMKNVGLNVASEPAQFLSYTGVKAGLVLAIGSDPGAPSSSNEQDDRWYSLHTYMPIIEPSNIQEAKDFTKEAFNISEDFSFGVILMAPSRLCHNAGALHFGDLRDRSDIKGNFEKDPENYLNLFNMAVKNHSKYLERHNLLKKYLEDSQFNYTLLPDTKNAGSKIGFISSGVIYAHLIEALDILEIYNHKILKLGFTFPIPDKLIKNFFEGLDKVVIVEEAEGFLEFQIKKIAYEIGFRGEIHGKDIFKATGELTLDDVIIGTGKFLEKTPPAFFDFAVKKSEELKEKLPQRSGTFCIGCPHRATIYAILKAVGFSNTDAKDRDAVIAGDIGCYTLGLLPPYNAMDFLTCMNAGLGIGQAISRFDKKKKVIALVGDSTFYHSGIPVLLNAVQNNADILYVILDNSWTAMTGHQKTPSTQKDIDGTLSRNPVNLKDLIKSLGVSYIKSLDPNSVKRFASQVKSALKEPGVKVLIAKRECILQEVRRNKLIQKASNAKIETAESLYEIQKSRCVKCNECFVELACPAIIPKKDDNENGEYYYIDPASCVRCGVCFEVCPNSAIRKVEFDLKSELNKKIDKTKLTGMQVHV